jgi:hypothetical protein
MAFMQLNACPTLVYCVNSSPSSSLSPKHVGPSRGGRWSESLAVNIPEIETDRYR